jgi:2-oxoisovalerate dehydrogenase E1 component alpha subunit
MNTDIYEDSIPTISFLDQEGNLSSDCLRVPSDDILLKGYKTMLLARHMDERMLTLQRQGAISFSLSALGEEACAVASAAALEEGDWLYPQYREMGVMFWRGATPEELIHQMFGSSKDLTKGRQMPNHFGSRALNVVHVSSPIGTKIPHAAGCAYAMKLQKDPHVAVAYFGEGATSEGDFHVGLNFAAVRKSPAIFFCRNNGFAISTPASKQFASHGIAPKGAGYGVITYKVDGNDFIAVYSVVAKARRLCLEGAGPILIEAITYRKGAHSTSDDPSVYREQQEVEDWNDRDPILRLRKFLEKKGLWNDTLEAEANEEIQKQVTAAIETAKLTPPPAIETLVEDVYFEIPAHLKQQLHQVQHHHS